MKLFKVTVGANEHVGRMRYYTVAPTLDAVVKHFKHESVESIEQVADYAIVVDASGKDLT